MIQPGGVSEGFFPGRRKCSGIVQEDAIYFSRRAPAQGTFISFHRVLYALTPWVVPVQSLGLVFVFPTPACTAVDPWSDHLAARVYVQHLSPDG